MKGYSNFNYELRLAFQSPLCQGELTRIINSLSKSQRFVLDKLLLLANKYGIIFPNQTTLGKHASIQRRQANAIVKQLCDLGIIRKIYRPNLTCIYSVIDLLFDPSIREQFKHLFKAFQFLCISLLFALPVLNLNCSRRKDIRNYINIFLKNTYPLPMRKTHKGKETYDCKSGKRRPLPMYSSPERTQLILELTKKFTLNKLGQIKLSPFPFEALQYAKEKFDLVSKPQSIRDTFSFFLSVCNTWCEQHGIPADWKTAYHLMEEFNLDPKGKVYSQEREVPTEQPSGHYQSKQKREYQKQSFSAKPGYSNQSNRAFDRYAEQQRTCDAITESKERLERKIQAAYNAGDNEEVAHLRRYEPDYIDWKNPYSYGKAKAFASQMPESVKKELIHSRDTDPNHAVHKYPPVLALLKEYEESQNNNEDQK